MLGAAARREARRTRRSPAPCGSHCTAASSATNGASGPRRPRAGASRHSPGRAFVDRRGLPTCGMDNDINTISSYPACGGRPRRDPSAAAAQDWHDWRNRERVSNQARRSDTVGDDPSRSSRIFVKYDGIALSSNLFFNGSNRGGWAALRRSIFHGRFRAGRRHPRRGRRRRRRKSGANGFLGASASE